MNPKSKMKDLNTIKTLAECKDEVAKKYGFDAWHYMLSWNPHNLDELIDEAAKLFASQSGSIIKPDCDKQAHEYVTNHPDSEVRRMYGHYFRTFKDGFNAASQFKASSQLPSGLEKPDFTELVKEIISNYCNNEWDRKNGEDHNSDDFIIRAEVEKLEALWRDYVSSPTAKREDVEELLNDALAWIELSKDDSSVDFIVLTQRLKLQIESMKK
jgi:uncharacterized protein (DUF2267 family)